MCQYESVKTAWAFCELSFICHHPFHVIVVRFGCSSKVGLGSVQVNRSILAAFK